ncbi:MAG: Bax inhibitor-1 family protein [Planctomycetes bacterium]|nr:Bax inhibitor-1 family protein [Planctomycetota bacterium]
MSNAFSIPNDRFVIELPVDARLAFIRKVYGLFLVSILGTAAVTAAVMSVPAVADLAGQYWWAWLVLYVGLSWGSNWIASQGSAFGYGLLAALSVVTGLFFGPTVNFYAAGAGMGVVYEALALTAAIFGGLTGYVFVTRQDFSFLRGALWVGMFALIGFGVLSMFVGFSFQVHHLVTLAGVVLFIGFILYDTSNIIHHYREDQFAVAAAAIYLDFVILFMKLLRLLGRRD